MPREIAEGVKDGEFARCDPDEVADRALALIDGYGIRALIGDPAIPLERAQRVGVGRRWRASSASRASNCRQSRAA